jgi:hypothetical protein
MALPGTGLPALCGLLFVVTLLAAPFRSARAALVRDLFPGGSDDAEASYALATTITTITTQAAQVAGFAAGGILTATLGSRSALAIDAATFALSAALIRLTVRSRPAPAPTAGHTHARGTRAGARLVFGDPWLRSLTLLAWLDAFLVVPAGVAVPYTHDRGGGPAHAGILLASIAAGTAAGMLALGRLDTPTRLRLMYPLAILAGLPLTACALNPNLTLTAILWALTGAATAYQLAANIAFVAAVPQHPTRPSLRPRRHRHGHHPRPGHHHRRRPRRRPPTPPRHRRRRPHRHHPRRPPHHPSPTPHPHHHLNQPCRCRSGLDRCMSTSKPITNA